MRLLRRARRTAGAAMDSDGANCASAERCDNLSYVAERFSITSDLITAMITETDNRDPQRLTAAIWLVVRRYCSQIRRRPALAIPALVLPGLGQILIFYAPPLIIARLLGEFASDARASLRELMPYVLSFAGVWLVVEAVWRVPGFLIA